MLKIKLSGRSSGVERNLAKVEVEGSNPTAPAYSFKKEIVPQHSSWLVVVEKLYLIFNYIDLINFFLIKLYTNLDWIYY